MAKARQWKRGGHGFIEDRKPDDIARLILESYNSLQYFTDQKRHTRIHIIEHSRKRIEGDLLAGVEPGTYWTIAKRLGGETYHGPFGLGEDKKSVCARNETKQTTKLQYGGTCMVAFGVFSSHIKNPEP